MSSKKPLVAIVVLAIAMAVAYGLPKARYQSLDILKEIAVPLTVGDWTGQDVKTGIQLMDDKYNFISALFLRQYDHPSGAQLYMFLLDAGNFHNPKVCLTSAGFSLKEMGETELAVGGQPPQPPGFRAPLVFIAKDADTYVVSYWITINDKRVDWFEQKAMEFWYSLIGRKKAGLMVRFDVPADEANVKPAEAVIQDFVAALSKSLADKDHRHIFGQ